MWNIKCVINMYMYCKMYMYISYLQTTQQVHHESIYNTTISTGYMYGSGGTQLNMFSSSFRMLLSVMCGGLAG